MFLYRSIDRVKALRPSPLPRSNLVKANLPSRPTLKYHENSFDSLDQGNNTIFNFII